MKVLIVGATGSIGRLVVEEALKQGHTVRVLVRSLDRASRLPSEAQRCVGDLTKGGTLAQAVDGVDAIVFTHGTTGGGKAESERVNYGGVRNVLDALGIRKVRIALMTTIGATERDGPYNRSTEAHDWKRRSERLVRASGMPYTVVRPGWFDYNQPDQLQLVLMQGDTRHAGNPSDGVVARRQIAEILVHSLTSPAATGKTFELVAEKGAASRDLETLLAALDADSPGAIDGVRDIANMPLEKEPQRILDDLRRFTD